MYEHLKNIASILKKIQFDLLQYKISFINKKGSYFQIIFPF